MKQVRWSLAAALALGTVAAPAAAQTHRTGDDAVRQSLYGSALAVGDREVLIAEPVSSRAPGVVYVYRRDRSGAWAETQRLFARDSSVMDRFGRSIAVDGATLLVGATSRDSSRGGAYVFTRDGAGRWTQAQLLVPAGATPELAAGRVVALQGDLALVASWAADSTAGAVYVYRRDRAGRWSEEAKLTASDAAKGDYFGTGLAVDGGRLVVGASEKKERAGAAYVFEYDREARAWKETARLEPNGLPANSGLGGAVVLRGREAYVAAPQFGGAGTVFIFTQDSASGEWRETGRLNPYDGGRGTSFGAALEWVGAELWIGAPGADEFSGSVYRLPRGASGAWAAPAKLADTALDRFDRFGAPIAARGDVAVIGIGGADFGEGVAVIYERDARSGAWRRTSRMAPEVQPLAAVTGGEVRCTAGSAAIFGCGEVDLLAFLPVQAIGGGRGVRLNDIWGWTDPETGREYALVGRIDGTSFVDVTDPTRPGYLGNLPLHQGARPATWRDIKVYKDHAFIVSDGAGPHGMQVFDLRRLRGIRNPPLTFTETAHYDRIASAHNIVINEATGFAFSVGNSMGGETCGGGLHMIDIRDPGRPTFAGCFADPATGRRKTGYTHDAQCVTYQGPDAEHRGREICFGANETALSIADVTDKATPKALARAEYPNVGYSHQGWLTEDQRYFLMDDELDELQGNVPGTRTLIWDVSDLDDPVLVKEFISENRATDHNLYVRGNLVYQSNYVSGLRILDITDPRNPKPAGHFDTVPWGEDAPGFGGSWSNYPFFRSGNVVVTSGQEGLFVVKKQERPVP